LAGRRQIEPSLKSIGVEKGGEATGECRRLWASLGNETKILPDGPNIVFTAVADRKVVVRRNILGEKSEHMWLRCTPADRKQSVYLSRLIDKLAHMIGWTFEGLLERRWHGDRWCRNRYLSRSRSSVPPSQSITPRLRLQLSSTEVKGLGVFNESTGQTRSGCDTCLEDAGPPTGSPSATPLPPDAAIDLINQIVVQLDMQTHGYSLVHRSESVVECPWLLQGVKEAANCEKWDPQEN
jgi:hypothetical protein